MGQPKEWGIGKAEGTLLGEILMDLRGHPRLTAWDEGFVVSIQRQLQEHGPRTRLSEKQQAVLNDLRRRVEAPETEEDPDLY